MARKPRPAGRSINTEINLSTMVRARLDQGRLMSVDGSVWLVRKAPMSPVVDAKTPKDRLSAFVPLLNAYEELAAMAPINGGRRSMSRKNYRVTQALLVNRFVKYTPAPGTELSTHLAKSFPNEVTQQRFLLLAVRLRDTVGNGGLREAIDSVAETLSDGTTPLSDYDKDTRRVHEALTRHGFTTPSEEELRVADSWWNRGYFPDTVNLEHADHMHLFADTNAARMAEDAGVEDCSQWPEIPNEHALTFATLYDVDFSFLSPESPQASWATHLVEDKALAISIRAKIEPAKITRDELRRQRKRYMDDQNERFKQGKMDRSEQEEMEQTLADVESLYATGRGSATLVDTSILVAFSGQVEDITTVGGGQSAANLRVMNSRQSQALAEMMLCSPVSANPELHDMPSQNVACSGIQSLNRVGDREGALIGFTERDWQPVLEDPLTPARADTGPFLATVGGTGSGKTMLLNWRLSQFHRMGHRQIFIDPKQGSDYSEVVRELGGRTISLDDLVSADGILDPIRFSDNPGTGVSLATSMIANINPWGGDPGRYEAQVQSALTFGVAAGGDCVGRALELAMEKNRISGEVAAPILRLAESHSLVGAVIGRFPQGQALRVNEGLTYIKSGSVSLQLDPDRKDPPLNERVSRQVVRMLVFGSKMALMGKDGVIHLDEAWTFLGGGRAELEEFGRTARSQRVVGYMYTQRISDALDAGLKGYISRGTILPIEDEHEAAAALEMFGMDATAERMSRITGKATIEDGENVMPNWNSMRALRDPETGQVVRGSIAVYVDVSGRAINTQVKIPATFLSMASTSLEDQRRREAERMEALATTS